MRFEPTSRRKFLVRLTQLVFSLAAASTLFRLSRKDKFVADIVRQKLPYLQVSDRDLLSFAYDFRKHAEQGQKKVIALCALFGPVFSFLQSRGRATPLAELQDKIAQVFLMSTDLFRRGGDYSRPVRYLALYDPYSSACSNPFAERAEG